MKFLVIGCGSIGKRHVRNLKALKASDIIAHDVNPERRREIAQQYGVKTHDSLEEAAAPRREAAIICTPSSLCILPALAAAENSCHLFIEKLLSHALDGVDELRRIVTQKGLATLVGCNMRFHPGIMKMKELLESGSVGKPLCARVEAGRYLPESHPWEDYRQGYAANKRLGGGVILDGIHEIDYITWFLGEVRQVFCFSGKLSSLQIDTEDTAEILLWFTSGAIAEVHTDYIQRFYGKSCQIIGEEGAILWDLNERQVKLYSAKTARLQAFREKPHYDINEMYIEEMKHFLQCIDGKTKPVQDITDAKRVLEIALAAKEASGTGKVVSL